MSKARQSEPKRSEVLALAKASVTDPRTAARWLKGEPVRPLVRQRLERAAAELKAGANS